MAVFISTICWQVKKYLSVPGSVRRACCQIPEAGYLREEKPSKYHRYIAYALRDRRRHNSTPEAKIVTKLVTASLRRFGTVSLPIMSDKCIIRRRLATPIIVNPGFSPRMKKTEIHSAHGRLDSRTVLITRARAQAEEMTVLLEGLGAKVIHVPTIEIIPPDDLAPLDGVISNLEEYNWIIFTSSNAVDFFIQRQRENRSGDVAVLGTRSICAIGTATARALEEAGIRASFVAQESTSEGVLRELTERIGGLEIMRELKILIPRAKVAREVLPSRLRDLGAHVDVVETYQTVLPQITRTSLKKLF